MYIFGLSSSDIDTVIAVVNCATNNQVVDLFESDDDAVHQYEQVEHVEKQVETDSSTETNNKKQSYPSKIHLF